MKVNFGPNISHNVKSLLHYASRSASKDLEHTLHSYHEDDHTLFTFVQNGTFTVNNVTVHIERSPEVYTLGENGLVSPFHGYLESTDLESIEKLFEVAVEYTKNLVNENTNKDSLKLLNFDYRWDCDSIIKKKTFAAIHLPSKVLGDFRGDIENFMSEENRKRFAELEIVPCRTYALYGPPGTGKTTLIHTIASHYSMNLATLSFDNTMNDKTLRSAMKKLPANTILYLEDIDCVFKRIVKRLKLS
jgi:ATP-dependent 26S proteasome regulatory subunit